MEKRFYGNYEFNYCKVFKELSEIILKNGGQFVSTWEKQLKLYEIINFNDRNKKFLTHFTTYINFMINDDIYYIQFDENPFFDDFFRKTKSKNMCSSNDVYSGVLPKKIANYKMTDEEIKENAKKLFDFLIGSDYSKYTDVKYKRTVVPNTYDGGYHYEKVIIRRPTEKYHVVELEKI